MIKISGKIEKAKITLEWLNDCTNNDIYDVP